MRLAGLTDQRPDALWGPPMARGWHPAWAGGQRQTCRRGTFRYPPGARGAGPKGFACLGGVVFVDQRGHQLLGRLERHGINAEHAAQDEADGLSLSCATGVVPLQRGVGGEQGWIVVAVQAS